MEFIPAKQKEKLFEDTGTKRVCAYCRVSTDDVNQTSSYELQKNHYEDMIKEHQGCDVFFDATFGDGFSDIYGKKWNIKTDLIKQMVIWSGTPLVLVPQTYGPYNNLVLKKWAMRLIRKADLVYSRDNLSAKVIKEQSGVEIKVGSDMAFKLPYDRTKYKIDNERINIGINVSSLLWDSQWAKENHFGLTVDYKQYHIKILEWLIEQSKYKIHIIPHVIDLEQPNARENDYRVCLQLKKKYGDKIEIVIVVSILISILYSHRLLRYSFILIISLAAFIKRKAIIVMLRKS